jgi:dihydropteroate synthase
MTRSNPLRRTITNWKLRGRTLELGRRTLVMGVVNITPDSFSDGGLYLDPNAAIAHAISLLDEGADLLDLGAESTRPGSKIAGADGDQLTSVSADQEQARLMPVLEGILGTHPDAIISADTYKASTAEAACGAGAEIVNDVSGLLWDPAMAAACAKIRCGVVLMHTRGRPHEWQAQSQFESDELLRNVRADLQWSSEKAISAGIPTNSIVLDPGYGFGKKFGENYALLSRQAELLELGRPLLAGVSRKSFLGHTLAPLHGGQTAPPFNRETASIAAMVAAILHGASIVRVHSVRSSVEAARIADAILAGGQ